MHSSKTLQMSIGSEDTFSVCTGYLSGSVEVLYLKSSSARSLKESVRLLIRSRYWAFNSSSVSSAIRSRYELIAVRGVLMSWEIPVTASATLRLPSKYSLRSLSRFLSSRFIVSAAFLAWGSAVVRVTGICVLPLT